MAAEFDTERMHSYLKGYFAAKRWDDALSALNFARAAHKEQKRKSGAPYILHPYTMASHALSVGLDNEKIVATCLLHDVVEDCNVLVQSLPVRPEIRESVRRLTHIKGEPLEPYYRQITEDKTACIVKLLDRCDNVSTMAGVFSREKITDYIAETETYVLPLLRVVKEQWPEQSDAVFVLKYHIIAVTDGLKIMNTAPATDSQSTAEQPSQQEDALAAANKAADTDAVSKKKKPVAETLHEQSKKVADHYFSAGKQGSNKKTSPVRYNLPKQYILCIRTDKNGACVCTIETYEKKTITSTITGNRCTKNELASVLEKFLRKKWEELMDAEK